MAGNDGDFRRLAAHIAAQTETIRETRRYFHAHPEPSGQEFRTTAYLAEQIEELGLAHRLGLDGRGLIVDFPHPKASRFIALRADIDALRLQDEKTVSYRSKENNLMHACGHDAHTAMALGAIRALSATPDLLPADMSWRFIFQPAEESATGAREMIEWQALDKVEAILALHVDPTLHAGQVGFREGALTACCEEFDLILEGTGGHGARPHTTCDPVIAAAQIVQAVYALLPRSHDARDPLVISFGVIQGGINPNVIPESVQLRGTIRSTDPALSRRVRQRMREIIDGIAQANNLRASFSIAYSLPAVNNDPALTHLCRNVCRYLLGEEGCVTIEKPSLGGEDFAWYLKEVPGCMLRLGVGTPLQPVLHLHSTAFDINEAALPIGARVLASCALAFARNLQNATS